MAARNAATLQEYLAARAAHRRRAALHSWIVVAVAPVSLGLLAFAAFWYASAWMRSKVVALCAAGYTTATILECAWAGPDDGEPGPGFGWMIGLTLLGGTVHLIAIRGRMARAMVGPRPTVPTETGVDPLEEDPAYREVVRRQARRERVRALVAEKPMLATELMVGRPDLRRTFDDGGLVDVNAVPASVLATLPGFTPALAEEVVRVRERVGPLSSVEELVVYGSVPPDVLERVRDLLLFRPAG